jgi:hypothetical protein
MIYYTRTAPWCQVLYTEGPPHDCPGAEAPQGTLPTCPHIACPPCTQEPPWRCHAVSRAPPARTQQFVTSTPRSAQALLASRPPHTGPDSSALSMITKVTNRQRPDPVGTSVDIGWLGLNWVGCRCIAKNPTDRGPTEHVAKCRYLYVFSVLCCVLATTYGRLVVLRHRRYAITASWV